MMDGSTTGTIFRAAGVMEAWVTRMPVWKLCCEMCWAKVRICFMPMEGSLLNSIQIVPIGGVPAGALEGGACFSSMAAEGRAEKVIFLRLKARISKLVVGSEVEVENTQGPQSRRRTERESH